MELIVAAAVGGWASIIGGLIHLHVRTSGSGPLAAKLDALVAGVLEVQTDVRSLRRELESHIADDRRHV